MSKKTDVLICGGGSAGLCAAMWLARCGIDFKILERRMGPMQRGQADGVQCRTVEVFESFGLSEDLLKEAYHVSELAFWAHSDDDDGVRGRGIRRTHYAADVEEGLSHQPHVILNQARVNEIMAEETRRVLGGGRDNIEYGYEVRHVQVDSAAAAAGPDAYCVSVTAAKDGVEETFQAKYVLGCDGAHSAVRKALGFTMVGDSTDAVWGVMDVYPQTDFPDIRKKAIINSEAGNLIIIPREGGSLARFYMEFPGARAADLTLEHLHEKARQIFRPFTVTVVETAWWSAYSIGQRRADYFTKDHRVFLTGDACHTHSPKAGQGMNVSLQDGYNIGWKLAAVLRGQAKSGPELLLETYVSERQKTATELIDFDRSWTRLFNTAYRQEHGITPEIFHQQFLKSGRFTAGQAVHYNDSVIMDAAGSDQSLATGLPVGMRLPSAQVVRFCDALAMQLVRALPATSQWHVLVFAGDIRDSTAMARLEKVSRGLQDIVANFNPPGSDPDSVINPLLVLSGKRTEVNQEQIPEVFTPIIGQRKIKCLFKTFVDDEGYNAGHGHAYATYGIEPEHGALVLVRPDNHIAKICSLDKVDSIRDFFQGFLRQDADGETSDGQTEVPPAVVQNPLGRPSRRDSAISDIAMSFLTRSVDPQVFEFIVENGRTYHSHHPGRYFLPNDEVCAAVSPVKTTVKTNAYHRLNKNEKIEHDLFDEFLDGRLFLAPTTELHNVLDIGTGTGIWAIELAKQFPSAFVIGTDLSPIQPQYIPVNCQFEIDDAEDPWVYAQKFDLIHGRCLGFCFESPATVVRSAVNALAPDGWLEFQDYLFPPRCDDGTWDGTGLKRWVELLGECLTRAGRSYYSHRLPDMFRDAGLIDVREVTTHWPLNPWAKGRRNKEVGRQVTISVADFLESASLHLFTRYGGMNKDEVLQFCREAMETAVDTRVHIYYTVSTVMGRKPS